MQNVARVRGDHECWSDGTEDQGQMVTAAESDAQPLRSKATLVLNISMLTSVLAHDDC